MENGNLSYFYYNANRASTSGTNNVSNSYQWYEYQYNQLNIRSSAHLNSRWSKYTFDNCHKGSLVLVLFILNGNIKPTT